MADKLNRVGIKVSAALHTEINVASATTGTPIYSLVERAWRAYADAKVKAGGGAPHESVGQATKGNATVKTSIHSEWTNLLEGILSSGHVIAIEAIIRNLQAFDVLIRSNKEGKVAHYQVSTAADLAADLPRAAERLKRISKADRSGNTPNTKRA